MIRRPSILVTLLFALAIGSATAHAAPITLIEGITNHDVVTVTASGDPGAAQNVLDYFQLTAHYSTEFNDVPVGPFETGLGLPLATITGTSVDGDITTYALASFFSTKQIVLADGSAIFSLTLTAALVDSTALNTLVLQGTEVLVSNTSPTFDFSPFASGGVFSYTLTANSSTNFNMTLTDGGQDDVNGAQ